MSDHFARELLKLAAIQLAESGGFHSMQNLACEVLAEVLERYIKEVGFLAHQFSEHACRVESNLYDLREAFNFLAASGLGSSLKELIAWVAETEELQFCKTVPLFPIQKKLKHKTELREAPEPLPAHIPPFLPPFPPKHTYKETPAFNKRTTDSKVLRKMKNKGKRQVESSLVLLNEKFKTKNTPHHYDFFESAGNFTFQPSITSSTTTTSSSLSGGGGAGGSSSSSASSGSSTSSSSSSKQNTANIIKNPFLSVPTHASRLTPAPTPIPPTNFPLGGNREDDENQPPTPSSSLRTKLTLTLPSGSVVGGDTPTTHEESEKARKRQKVERILSLTHLSGIEQLDNPEDANNPNNQNQNSSNNSNLMNDDNDNDME